MRPSFVLAAAMTTCLLGTRLAAAQPVEAPLEKDADLAANLSVGGTLLSMAVLTTAGILSVGDTASPQVSGTLAVTGLVGLAVTPSLGHWYGRGQVVTTGNVLRLSGLGLATLSFALLEPSVGSLPDSGGSPEDRRGGNDGAVALGVIAGTGLFVAGVVHDIWTARSATEAANDTRRDRFRAQVAPTAIPTVAGVVPGVGIGGTF